jgi:GntR family transcriptional repressor for pyruvate dehydrogenase complex
MILLIGSLELIWSAHESSVWSDDGEPTPMVGTTKRAALRDHQRLLDAISDGNAARAIKLARDHLAAARRKTLAFGSDKTIEAKRMSDIGPRLDVRSADNGQQQSRKESSR